MLYTSSMDIEKNIPIPEKVRGRKPKYEFAKMDIGDSFFAAGDSSVQVSILTCARRYRPKKFVTQKTTTEVVGEGTPQTVPGFRCWRVE